MLSLVISRSRGLERMVCHDIVLAISVKGSPVLERGVCYLRDSHFGTCFLRRAVLFEAVEEWEQCFFNLLYSSVTRASLPSGKSIIASFTRGCRPFTRTLTLATAGKGISEEKLSDITGSHLCRITHPIIKMIRFHLLERKGIRDHRRCTAGFVRRPMRVREFSWTKSEVSSCGALSLFRGG
ncbi:unnamed protein product [Arabidopsis thaliana]|uniref:(thale cress) hypothetical protein n=1 Tax=Arabidopsis thaliana TaxID=3702 RepID=A0A7G2EPU1_ARATH|nr:unnamed protein product [Arabidopsis thaliana]